MSEKTRLGILRLMRSGSVVVLVVVAVGENLVVVFVPDGSIHFVEALHAECGHIVGGVHIIGAEEAGLISQEVCVCGAADEVGDVLVESVVGHDSPDVVESSGVVHLEVILLCSGKGSL